MLKALIVVFILMSFVGLFKMMLGVAIIAVIAAYFTHWASKNNTWDEDED